MKKLINAICILFLSCSLFAENSAVDANRNTALRCLKLAESCLMGGDWDNALSQAELGLSYDESISDLIYIKAAAEINLNKSKAEVINQIEKAFVANNWVGYTVNGARILYADLLSDVGRYEKSMNVLDDAPFVFSADAEFIRIKNLYRMGTAQSLNDARLKVNSSRRIYPKDLRFPQIFFMFELLYKNAAIRQGIDYDTPEIVKTIAGSYIANLPDYKGDKLAIELMATFFANKEEQERLVKAIDAKGTSENALLAIAGLNSGLYSQQHAFDLFFSTSNDMIPLGLLENFVILLTEEDVKKQVVEKLNNYSGTIIIDENLDLQPDLVVEYNTGRPSVISYDYNNDGVVDLYSTCDFGAPDYIYSGLKKIKINYSAYPHVANISFEGKDFVFNFLDKDYKLNIIELTLNNILNTLGLQFYIPSIVKEVVIPEVSELANYASSVELPIEERINSKVVYTTLEGKIISAEFFENNNKYAYCDFSKGFPIDRYVDNDNDGKYETKETFAISDKPEDFITDEERSLIDRVFNPVTFYGNIYLSKVQLDRNCNNSVEFSEQYLGLDGKITIWDNDDNGIPDAQYIKYPVEDESAVKEDSIFFDENGSPEIIINFLNNVPVKMSYKDSEVMIYAGKTSNFYWIEENGDFKTEKYILEHFGKKLSNGVIQIIQIGEVRANVIKVNDNIFCKIIPLTTVDLIEE